MNRNSLKKAKSIIQEMQSAKADYRAARAQIKNDSFASDLFKQKKMAELDASAAEKMTALAQSIDDLFESEGKPFKPYQLEPEELSEEDMTYEQIVERHNAEKAAADEAEREAKARAELDAATYLNDPEMLKAISMFSTPGAANWPEHVQHAIVKPFLKKQVALDILLPIAKASKLNGAYDELETASKMIQSMDAFWHTVPDAVYFDAQDMDSDRMAGLLETMDAYGEYLGE